MVVRYAIAYYRVERFKIQLMKNHNINNRKWQNLMEQEDEVGMPTTDFSKIREIPGQFPRGKFETFSPCISLCYSPDQNRSISAEKQIRNSSCLTFCSVTPKHLCLTPQHRKVYHKIHDQYSPELSTSPWCQGQPQ